jgi:hypothetical protein
MEPVQGRTFDPVPTLVYAKPPDYCKLIQDVQEKLVAPGVIGCEDSLLGFELHMERSGVSVHVLEPTLSNELIHVTVRGLSRIPVLGVVETQESTSQSPVKSVKMHVPRGGAGRRVMGFLLRGRPDDALFKVRECSTVWLILEALADAERA